MPSSVLALKLHEYNNRSEMTKFVNEFACRSGMVCKAEFAKFWHAAISVRYLGKISLFSLSNPNPHWLLGIN